MFWLPCPACKSSVEKDCALCGGEGFIPPLEATLDADGIVRAVYYWECACVRRIDGWRYSRLHTARRRECPDCHTCRSPQNRALAGYVKACLSNFYKVEAPILLRETPRK
jgi:hypothetical protein